MGSCKGFSWDYFKVSLEGAQKGTPTKSPSRSPVRGSSLWRRPVLAF